MDDIDVDTLCLYIFQLIYFLIFRFVTPFVWIVSTILLHRCVPYENNDEQNILLYKYIPVLESLR